MLAVSLASTAAAWQMAQSSVQEDARLRFEAKVARLTPLIARRLSAYEQVLRGGVSVFDTWGEITRDQWRAYVEGLRIEANYPGVQGIGYAEIVPPDEIDAHVARVRAEGFPDYDLRPRGDRPQISAVVYLEPFDWRNQRAFGYDMLSEPTRRTAMERARDTGEAALSGRVILLQETESDTQPGFLLYLPVYANSQLESVEARRDALRGFVYAPFRMGDLMRAVLGNETLDVRLAVYDGASIAASELMFDSANDAALSDSSPRFATTTALEPSGHRWTLLYSTLPGFEAQVDSAKPVIVLASGIAVSLLLFWIAWAIGRNATRARRQEADFRYLFDKNPSIMWVFDRETLHFLAVNEAAVERYGYSADEFMRMRITDIRPSEDVQRLLDFVKAPAAGLRDTGEWRHRTKSGDELLVQVTSFSIRFAGRDAALVVARDQTERRRAEAARRRSEALRAAVLESALDAVIVIDDAGLILEFNPAAEQTFGYRGEHVMGRDLADVVIPPRHRDAHRAGLDRFKGSGASTVLRRRLEITGLRADGSEFPVEIAISAADVEGRTIFTGYVRDVTELRKAQAELQQAQKMEAIGRLTGGVAHDFNNLMTVVLGNAELLSMSPRIDGADRAHAAQIIAVAERAADLTGHLLAFARRQPLAPKETDLARLVAGMEAILRRTLGEDIEILVSHDDALWPVLADPAQLQSALLNIAINGRDAMSDGGKLTIESRNVRLDEDYAASNEEVTPGDYVALSVSDSGIGMDPETLARAFEPFFTTKDVGKGTGLGLSMIYGFAKQSGGHVNIYSEVGQGTTVRLYLPRFTHEPGATQVATAEPQAALPTGAETILVVEDNEMVREQAVRQLRALGYQVQSAADGPSGLTILQSPARIDLLFTDVVMPGGMKGPELAQAARALRPSIRILFTSGYSEGAVVNNDRLDPGGNLLQKPYRRHELAHRVRQVLDGVL